MTLNAKELYTRKEVAKLFGVSDWTVKEWQRTRGLKATRLSSQVLRFHRDDLAAFIAAAKQ